MIVLYAALAIVVLLFVTLLALEIVRWTDGIHDQAELDEQAAAERMRPHGNVVVFPTLESEDEAPS